MAGAGTSKVLGMLWKQAGIGCAIGGVVGMTYWQTVAKPDMKKINDYYAKLEAGK